MIFEVPIAFKPIPINMNCNLEEICVSDFSNPLGWNIDMFHNILGTSFNLPVISNGTIGHGHDNGWVWFPKMKTNKLSATIYSHLNCGQIDKTPWQGWGNIWKLNVTPRVKTFLWLLIQRKLKTYDFLYVLNLGFLEKQMITCLDCATKLRTFGFRSRIRLICTFLWLNFDRPDTGKFIASIISTVTWYIWKVRCDYIFDGKIPNYNMIANLFVNQVKVFKVTPDIHKQLSFFIWNKPNLGVVGFFLAACQDTEICKGGVGFCIIDTNASILCAGFSPIMEDTNIAAEGRAILLALERVADLNQNCKHSYINKFGFVENSSKLEEVNNWRIANFVDNIKLQMRRFNELVIHLILTCWNKIATTLASKGLNSNQLSAYLAERLIAEILALP